MEIQICTKSDTHSKATRNGNNEAKYKRFKNYTKGW